MISQDPPYQNQYKSPMMPMQNNSDYKSDDTDYNNNSETIYRNPQYQYRDKTPPYRDKSPNNIIQLQKLKQQGVSPQQKQSAKKYLPRSKENLEKTKMNSGNNRSPQKGDLDTNGQMNMNNSNVLAETTNLQSIRRMIREGLGKSLLCKIHKEPYTLYCQYDKKLCCVDCLYAQNTHKRHQNKVISVKSALDILKNENSNFKEDIKSKINSVDQAMKLCELNSTIISDRVNTYKIQINRDIDELIRLLQNKKIELFEKLDLTFIQKTNENQMKIDSLTFLKNITQEVREFEKHLDKDPNISGNDPERIMYQFHMSNLLRDAYSNMNLKVEPLGDTELSIVDFHQKSRIIKEISTYGKLSKIKPNLKDEQESNHSTIQRKNLTKNKEQYRRELENDQQQQQQQQVMTSVQFNMNSSDYQDDSGIFYSEEQQIDQETLMQRTLFVFSRVFQDSKIITKPLMNLDLISVLPIGVKDAQLLYKLSTHGSSSNAFHVACDGHSPCLVIIKANRFHIFGYFITIPFQSNNEGFTTCDDAWIFSLTDGTKRKPVKFHMDPSKKNKAFYQTQKSPVFINGFDEQAEPDLLINFDDLTKSCSTLGNVFQIPPFVKIERDCILAGKKSNWSVHEIEIYKLLF